MEMFFLDVLSGVVCYITVVVAFAAIVGAVANRITRQKPSDGSPPGE